VTDNDLKPGLEYEWTRQVTPEMSARHLGSGDVGVLSTPSMIAMMEGASTRCAQPHLPEGQTTVGYIVNIRHLAPTAIGREVRARSRLESIDGRNLQFRVEAYEGDKLVGEGEHVRVVIDSSRFLKDAGAQESGG
jgi:predicted thioesterase